MSKKFIAFGVLLLALVAAGTVYAQSEPDGIIEGNWPDGVEVWRVDGKIFQRVTNEDGTVNMYYWCEGECDGKTCPRDPNFTPTPPVDETPTPPVETPTITPTPPDETPIAKQPCNRGVGNSGNDCDPGNSSGQGGGGGRPAGEDRDENDTGPGNSGSNGNQNDRGRQ